MDEELSKELFDMAVGMRNAGAERSAVVQRLQQEGFGFEDASALIDRVDAQIAQLHGARPADMSSEIAARAESARLANLAATGLAPWADRTPAPAPAPAPAEAGSEPSRSSFLVPSPTEQLASEGHMLLIAGMDRATLKQQWIAAGHSEAAAQSLLEAAEHITVQNEERKQASQKRTQIIAIAVMAVLGGLGIFGIFLMLQGPTSAERASSIAWTACGADEARVLKVRGQVLLLGGELMDVKNSLSAEDENFDEVFQSGANGQPDRIACSVVSLLPITYCDGYTDISTDSIFFPRDDERDKPELTVQIQGAALIVELLEMETFDSVDSARVERNPDCPLIHRSTFGNGLYELHRPDQDQALQAIRELVPA